ncbi:MAG: hypothetical protein AAB019_08480 [Planctomycetota bacterium]
MAQPARVELNKSSSVEEKESGHANLNLWEKIEEKLPEPAPAEEIEKLLKDLFNQDFQVRVSAINQLSKLGQAAAVRLVEMLKKDPTDSTGLFQITYALEEIGKKSIPALLNALYRIEDFKTTLDISLMENIVETLIRLRDKSSAGWLAQQINKINQNLRAIEQKTGLPETNKEKNGTSPLGAGLRCHSANEVLNRDQSASGGKKKYELYQTARFKIHDLLGEMEAPDGLDDLLILLGDGTKRVPVDIIETLAKVGDRRALVPLIRLYPIESTISEWGARFIKLTFREIVKREKISKFDKMFKVISAEEKKNLDKIFPNQRITPTKNI